MQVKSRLLAISLVAAAVPIVVYLRRKMRKRSKVDDSTNHEETSLAELPGPIDMDQVMDNLPKRIFLRIPNFAIAAVIGKQGRVLRKIQNETQTIATIVSYSPDQLLKVKFRNTNEPNGWRDAYNSEDWFAKEDSEKTEFNIQYLVVDANDEKQLENVRSRVSEIIRWVMKDMHSTSFLIENENIGFVIGRGGRNVKNLQAKFGVRIQVIPTSDGKAEVSVRGRDLNDVKEVELIIRNTSVPSSSKEERGCQSNNDGLFADVNEEIEFIQKTMEFATNLQDGEEW